MGGFWGSLRDCLAGEHGSRALEERADYTHDYSIWVQLVKDYFKWFGWSGIADRSIEKRAKSKPPHAKPAYGAPTEGAHIQETRKVKIRTPPARAGLKTVGMRHPKAFSELRRGHPASFGGRCSLGEYRSVYGGWLAHSSVTISRSLFALGTVSRTLPARASLGRSHRHCDAQSHPYLFINGDG